MCSLLSIWTFYVWCNFGLLNHLISVLSNIWSPSGCATSAWPYLWAVSLSHYSSCKLYVQYICSSLAYFVNMFLLVAADMSSTAFIEPLPVIDFVTQLLNRDVSSRPLSDADRVKVSPSFVFFIICLLLMKLGGPFCKLLVPQSTIVHQIPGYLSTLTLIHSCFSLIEPGSSCSLKWLSDKFDLVLLVIFFCCNWYSYSV